MKKPAITGNSIHTLIAERWSPRAFDPDKAVSHEDLISLCEAARWAPSNGSEEPWRYLIVDKFLDYDSWKKILDVLDPYNKIWVVNAPLIFVEVYKKDFTKKPVPNHYAMHDLGASAMNLHLQAVSLGLISHPIAGFNKDELTRQFNIPDDFAVAVIIAVGHPGELTVLDEFNQKRELSERKRRLLSDTFFLSEWGKPID